LPTNARSLTFFFFSHGNADILFLCCASAVGFIFHIKDPDFRQQLFGGSFSLNIDVLYSSCLFLLILFPSQTSCHLCHFRNLALVSCNSFNQPNCWPYYEVYVLYQERW